MDQIIAKSQSDKDRMLLAASILMLGAAIGLLVWNSVRGGKEISSYKLPKEVVERLPFDIQANIQKVNDANDK